MKKQTFIIRCLRCDRTVTAETVTGVNSWIYDHHTAHDWVEKFPSLLWGEKEWFEALKNTLGLYESILDGIAEGTRKYRSAKSSLWYIDKEEQQRVDRKLGIRT